MTDSEIIAIRDEHLPSQGEPFDCIAFARAVLAYAQAWRPLDEGYPQPGVPVIALVENAHGGEHSRRIRAQYAAQFTLPAVENDDGGEYDEETDDFYCPEGWYETNAFEETHWSVDGTVTHWLPLPPLPGSGK